MKTFGKVKFTEAGTYTWTVTETHKGETLNGITYDKEDKIVTIKVKDDGTGNLIAEDDSALVQTASFTNNYATSGTGEVKVKKNLVGRDWITEDSFEFKIEPVGDAPEFKNDTVTVTSKSEDYTESFGTVTFTKAGTYQWTVTETHAGEEIDGIKYDAAPKTVTIKVKDDGKGGLIAEDGSALVQTAEFTNNYSKSGVAEIKVMKNLSGRDWDTNDSFEFTITPASENAPAFETNKVTVTKDSEKYTESFGTVTFTEVGRYEYTISETHKGETIDGVKYDAADKTVVIEVEDDNHGNLVAKNGSSLDVTQTFINTYSKSGAGQIKVQKVLEGRDWTDDD